MAKQRFGVFFALLTLLTGGHLQAYASDGDSAEMYDYLLNLSMEDLTQIPIQSAGLFAMPWDQAPGLNYVVTKDQLDRYDVRSLAEYLNRMAPAFSTVIHGTQGTTVGVRGIMIDNSAKTLLLRDNINMNNRFFVGVNGSELSSPLLGDIERVEVASGPGVLQHGSGAINGYLNVVGATGESKEGVRMHTSYGSGDSRLVEGSYGQVISPKANIFFYAGYDKSNGVRPEYTFSGDEWSNLHLNSHPNDPQGTPSETFLDNVRVGKTDDDYKFSVRGQFGRKEDGGQLDLTILRSHTSNVDPVLGEYLSPDATWAKEVELAATAFGGRYSPFYEQQADNFLVSPGFLFQLNDQNEVKLTPYYQTIKTASVFSDFLRNEAEALGIPLNSNLGDPNQCPANNCGAEYTYGDEIHLGTTLIHTYTGIKDQTIAWGAEMSSMEFKVFPWRWKSMGFFAEDRLIFGDFTLLPGLRYDRTSFSDTIESIPPFADGPYQGPNDVDALTKRLALSYTITPQQTAKLSYQEGFRFADAWPQQWGAHISASYADSLQVEPEESVSYEADYSLVGIWNRTLDASVAIYYNQYDKLHGYNPNIGAFGAFTNSSEKLTSVGGDLTLEYHPVETWEFGASYSYARPIDSYESGTRVANADDTWTRYPNHMIKFRFGHQVTKSLFVGTTGVVESPRYEKENVTDPRVKALFDTWSLVMDVNAWYRIDRHWTLAASAKELLRKEYNQYPAYYSGTRPLDAPRPNGPQYYVSLSYTF